VQTPAIQESPEEQSVLAEHGPQELFDLQIIPAKQSEFSIQATQVPLLVSQRGVPGCPAQLMSDEQTPDCSTHWLLELQTGADVGQSGEETHSTQPPDRQNGWSNEVQSEFCWHPPL
jgi:hypothetical protein